MADGAQEIELLLAETVAPTAAEREGAEQAVARHQRVAGIGADAVAADEFGARVDRLLHRVDDHRLLQFSNATADSLPIFETLQGGFVFIAHPAGGIEIEGAAIIVHHEVEIGVELQVLGDGVEQAVHHFGRIVAAKHFGGGRRD